MSGKQITMNLWGFVFGQDVKVKMLKGSLEEVLSEIRDLSPVKDLGVIRESLNKAVWSEEVQWLGGHQVGLEVLSVASDPTVWSLLPKAVGAN